MNLNELATAKLSEVKSFCRANNLIPTSDLRLKQSWIDAAQAFLSAAQEKVSEVVEIATSPEAIATYKAATIVTLKFTYRAFVIASLVVIALGMSTRDAVTAFREWVRLQGLSFTQPIDIVQCIVSKVRKRSLRLASRSVDRLDSWIQSQTVRGWHALNESAIQPAQQFRQRLNSARTALLS